MLYSLPNLRVFLQLQRGLLVRYGWMRAWWRGKPVDALGEPLPWLTYPAIDFLAQFDFSEASVFEWGSGFSTLWWSKRARAVTTVESNPDWLPYMKTLLPASVELIEKPFARGCPEPEVEAIVNHPRHKHDVIVIDNHGPFRWQCANVAVEHLADGGMIIVDNGDQCLKACEVLRSAGLIEVDFSGFVPGNGYAHTTSIFFRSFLKFKPISPQPARCPAQPNSPWPKC